MGPIIHYREEYCALNEVQYERGDLGPTTDLAGPVYACPSAQGFCNQLQKQEA
jgi:hypothetical protein